MSDRDIAIGVVKIMSEEKIKAFLELFADENLKARAESEIIAGDPNRKHYNSFAEIQAEIFKDEE